MYYNWKFFCGSDSLFSVIFSRYVKPYHQWQHLVPFIAKTFNFCLITLLYIKRRRYLATVLLQTSLHPCSCAWPVPYIHSFLWLLHLILQLFQHKANVEVTTCKYGEFINWLLAELKICEICMLHLRQANDANRKNKLFKAESGVDSKLATLKEVVKNRMLTKLLAIMDNLSQNFHKTRGNFKSSFSNRFMKPFCHISFIWYIAQPTQHDMWLVALSHHHSYYYN